MFLAIVRYTCKQYKSLESLPGKLLMLITNPVSDFYCHKRNMSKNQLLAFWTFFVKIEKIGLLRFLLNF